MKRKNTLVLQVNLKNLCPKDWRIGQLLFNFGEWLATVKGHPTNQSYRMADMFHLSDKEFERLFEEYVLSIK